MRFSGLFLYLIVVFCLFVGCNARLNEEDRDSMRRENDTWNQQYLNIREILDESAFMYRKLHPQSEDTSLSGFPMIPPDSSITPSKGKAETTFENWFGKLLACNLELKSQIESNSVWIEETALEQPPKGLALKAWDARKKKFQVAYAQCFTTSSMALAMQAELNLSRKGTPTVEQPLPQ